MMASSFLFHRVSIVFSRNEREIFQFLQFNKFSIFNSNTSCHHQKMILNKNEKQNGNELNEQSFHLDNIPFQIEMNQTSIGSMKLSKELIKQKQSNKETNKELTVNDNFQSKRMKSLKQVLIGIYGLVEEITHIDDVRKAQNKVMDIRNKLEESGEYKRKILSDLNAVRDQMQKLHSDMRLINRGSESHIQLLDLELDCLKKERKIQDEFRAADEIERELFRNLTFAINESHEKEKIHTNSLRTWGYIQAIIVSFFTFCVTIIGIYYHNNKFGLLARTFQESINSTIKFEIGSLKTDVKSLKMDVATRLNQLEKKLEHHERQQESWGGYVKRHSYNVYRFFWPKRQ